MLGMRGRSPQIFGASRGAHRQPALTRLVPTAASELNLLEKRPPLGWSGSCFLHGVHTEEEQ